MRLVGQLKLGFFPAPPAAVRSLAWHLTRAGEPGATAMLDPCAGEGAAMETLATALGVAPGAVYAVELDSGRAEAVRARLPRAHVLGPASALAATITPRSFSLVYVNPPFDNELGGGGREEVRFLSMATAALAPGGVLALVVPDATGRNFKLAELLDAWYDELARYRFPAAVRKFQEVVILGRRRALPMVPKEAPTQARGWRYLRDDADPELGGDGRTWEVPAAGPGPRQFAKRDLTNAELLDALAKSPLHGRLLAPPPPPRHPRPPLPPGDGQVALLIAAGHLDGLVEPPDGPAHVVRGTARKEKYLIDQVETIGEDGRTESTAETWGERTIYCVRTAEANGTLRTFEL